MSACSYDKFVGVRKTLESGWTNELHWMRMGQSGVNPDEEVYNIRHVSDLLIRMGEDKNRYRMSFPGSY